MKNIIYYDGDQVTVYKHKTRNKYVVNVRNLNKKHKAEFSFKTRRQAELKRNEIFASVHSSRVPQDILQWRLPDIGNHFLSRYTNKNKDYPEDKSYIDTKTKQSIWRTLWRFHEAYCDFAKCKASRVQRGPNQTSKYFKLLACDNPYMTLANIKNFDEMVWANYLDNATGLGGQKFLSKSTLDNARKRLNQIFSAIDASVMPDKYFNFKLQIHTFVHETQQREAFNKDEVQLLFRTMGEYESPYRYLWYIAFNTGLRTNELLALRPDHLRHDNNGHWKLYVERILYKQTAEEGNEYVIRMGTKTYK